MGARKPHPSRRSDCGEGEPRDPTPSERRVKWKNTVISMPRDPHQKRQLRRNVGGVFGARFPFIVEGFEVHRSCYPKRFTSSEKAHELICRGMSVLCSCLFVDPLSRNHRILIGEELFDEPAKTHCCCQCFAAGQSFLLLSAREKRGIGTCVRAHGKNHRISVILRTPCSDGQLRCAQRKHIFRPRR